MYHARLGARAAVIVLVVSLLCVLTLRTIQSNVARGSDRSGATYSVHRDRDRHPLADVTSAAAPNRTDRIAVYRGLGTWIDIYDVAWRHPGAAVRKMAREGIRTLYLQTSNFSRGKPFVYRTGVGRFLDAAHREGIRVVAWYLPGFRNVWLDLHRSLAAVRYRSPNGNRFDSYAVDIESPAVARASTRTRRLLALSTRLRKAVGPDYPLGAIIPSPRGLDDSGTYWPRFPFRPLARLYDVFLPMTYFTWRVSGEQGAHWYTAESIGIIRRRTHDHTVPIHVIGGIGASPSETRGFVAAIRERGAIGASYYTFPITPSDDWQPLQQVQAIPDARPALPVSIPFEPALGNVPGRDTSHPKEVVYKVGGRRGRYRVAYDGFDIQSGEVTLLVNWRRVATLPAGTPGGWGSDSTVAVPPKLLNRDGTNYVSFVARGSTGSWPTWGVRAVRLVRPRAPNAASG
ncbi:MAG: hypothetical protein ACXVP7_01930 [Actinomycetota bacterium]